MDYDLKCLCATELGWQLNAVDALLLVDQVARLVDEAHQLVDALRPIVQHIRRSLLRLKVNDAGRPIDLDRDRAVVDQLGQVLFGLAVRQTEQLAHALDVDARVVVWDDADILQYRKETNSVL